MSGVIKRYRFMALAAGVMSLLLWFIYMPAKYLFDATADHKIFIAIPIVHGYLFMVYLITVLQVAVKNRWNIVRMLWTMLAGTIPVASFVAERRVVKELS